jgi:hypothetical protein
MPRDFLELRLRDIVGIAEVNVVAVKAMAVARAALFDPFAPSRACRSRLLSWVT